MKDLQSKLEAKNWRFAKSMPNIPHSYVRRSEWGDDLDFENVVIAIRNLGTLEKFYSKTFVYLYLGDYKYWTMGAHPSKTEIINRAKYDR